MTEGVEEARMRDGCVDVDRHTHDGGGGNTEGGAKGQGSSSSDELHDEKRKGLGITIGDAKSR